MYPLDEEGSYGEAPRQPGIPRPKPQYEPRERKPKVYSSYAVDSECETHGKKVRYDLKYRRKTITYSANSRTSYLIFNLLAGKGRISKL